MRRLGPARTTSLLVALVAGTALAPSPAPAQASGSADSLRLEPDRLVYSSYRPAGWDIYVHQED